jgi:succinate dehydrogenase subunit C
MNVRLYVWQRATAAIMAPLVLAHIAVIFYATRHDLSAADILGRTRGSALWASFYSVFVIAVAIHAAIGAHNVLVEWSPMNQRHSGILATMFGCCLLLLGLRAVGAVVLS